ncbi:hypothetical protein [Streptomyces sp. CBMA123]|uniref:hypothetical protein n=1 Tax=Streptomyces sp. CBMA123 TaxID=1896313 RepID=UPI00166201FE|nr:hypothetical protein [Streptomyces sp. CBMA123]MBD0694122.1 hypothetical protein [Streptomyces sp. CBMA123]
MHLAGEVRDPRSEVGNLPDDDVPLPERELSTAEQLIEILAVDWDPDQWHGTYSEEVRDLVQAKAEGRQIVVSQGPPAEATNVVDLMAILERSLDQARRPATSESADAKPESKQRKRTVGTQGRAATSTTGVRVQPIAGTPAATPWTRTPRRFRAGRGARNRASVVRTPARPLPSGLGAREDGRPTTFSTRGKGTHMGDHSKQAPDPAKGSPPPNNADGKVEKPSAGTGKHKKD